MLLNSISKLMWIFALVLSISQTLANDEEIQRTFRRFLETRETAFADKAIAQALREGNLAVARRLRFEAVKHLTSSDLHSPSNLDRKLPPILTEQMDKLLAEIPSLSWTAPEADILDRTRAVNTYFGPRLIGSADELLPPHPLLRPDVKLYSDDTFANLTRKIEQAPRHIDGIFIMPTFLRSAYRSIIKLGMLKDPRGVDFLIHLYRTVMPSNYADCKDPLVIFPALRQIGGKRASDFLYEVFQNENDPHHLLAGYELFLMGDRRVPASADYWVKPAIASDREEQIEVAHEVLRKIKDPKAIEPLLLELQKLTNNIDGVIWPESVRLNQIFLTLGEMGDARVLDRLEQARTAIRKNDKKWEQHGIYVSIAQALLGQMPYQDGNEFLKLLSKEDVQRDPQLNVFVARALARLHVNSSFKTSAVLLRRHLNNAGISFEVIDSIMGEFNREAKENISKCAEAVRENRARE